MVEGAMEHPELGFIAAGLIFPPVDNGGRYPDQLDRRILAILQMEGRIPAH
jgi:hypothetical protein